MKGCREFEQLMDRARRDSASEKEREILLDHLESCRDCSTVFEALGRLAETDVFPEPTEAETLSVRRAVIRKIRRRQASGEPRRRFSVPSFLARPATVSALSLVVFALGFLLGQGINAQQTSFNTEQALSDPDRFMNTIKTVAQSHNAYEDIVKSPFTYTDVRLTEGETGIVHLSFDVARHLDLSLKRDDPLVTEVLVQSLIERSAVDTRLAAITMAENLPDPKIKKSLIVAMLHDENLAVRMTAQSRLVERPGDPEISNALLAVLEQEPSVQMRLVAIDYLTNGNIQPNRLEKAIRTGETAGRQAVLVKAGPYLYGGIEEH